MLYIDLVEVIVKKRDCFTYSTFYKIESYPRFSPIKNL